MRAVCCSGGSLTSSAAKACTNGAANPITAVICGLGAVGGLSVGIKFVTFWSVLQVRPFEPGNSDTERAHLERFSRLASDAWLTIHRHNAILIKVNARTHRAAHGMHGQDARFAMDILFDPVLTVAPFALFVGLIAVVLRTLGRGDEKTGLPFRSARDILEEHLTRQDISREEYVERRKALDYITGMV